MSNETNPNAFEVSFPGGVSVAASHRGHTVLTDQPTFAGGQDAAMAPFDLFLASIATCGGLYALRFCQERAIDTEGLGLTLSTVRVPDRKGIAGIRIDLRLPKDFPDKYRQAIVRAVDQCAVKRTVMDPPQFEIAVVDPVGAEK